MITQYPHTISLTVVSGASKNAQGNWTGSTPTTVEITGRYEPNKGNGFTTTVDGEKINYDGIFYMPLPQNTIAPGTKAEVKNGAEVLLKNTVKRFSAGQLNARIWL